MGPIRWFWLSFADPDLPEGEQFLGVIIMPVDKQVIELIDGLGDQFETMREDGREEGIPFLAAVGYASLIGKNPGGEVQGWEITQKIDTVPLSLRGRLLNRDELNELESGSST